jgi:mannose-6-phosphate isomerase-like protein (cupin superfamily)
VRFEYDFQIARRPAGVYVLEDDGSELRQLVDYETQDGVLGRNEHLVPYQQGRALAYRVGTSGWVDRSNAPSSHWPTAAYPLLVRANVSEYHAIDEGTGQVTRRTLEYADGRVVERQGDRVVRAFELRGDDIVRIDWGGAISVLQPGSPG